MPDAERETDLVSPLGNALVSAAEEDRSLVLLACNLAGEPDVEAFAAAHPTRYTEVGSVRDLVDAAVASALAGRRPVAAAPAASFASDAIEAVADLLVRPRHPVVLAGHRPGITGGSGQGRTAVDDIARLRTLPGLTLIDPCDPWEARQAFWAVLEHDGPVYLRTLPEDAPADVDPETHSFAIGVASLLHGGDDVGIVASSTMVRAALEAAWTLGTEGVSAAVVNVSTAKPFDAEAVAHLAERTGALVTAENHRITGGLFSIVCETLATRGPGVPVVAVGVGADDWVEAGPPDALAERWSMTPAGVAAAARQAIAHRAPSGSNV